LGEIKKQSINSTILSYIGAFIGFLSLIYIQPRYLGSENMGLIKLIYNFSLIVAMFLPLGMGNVTMRFFPKFKNEANRHNGYFALLVLMVSVGAILTFVFFVLFKNEFQRFYSLSPKFNAYYYYCFIFAYIYALISVCNIYCASLLKTTFSVFLTDIYAKLALILVSFLSYFHIIGEQELVICYILSFVLQLVMLVTYLYKLNAVSLTINWHFFRNLDKNTILIFALVMTFTSFASLGIKYIDTLIIGHYVIDLKMVAIYSVCAFMPTILEIPFNSVERISQAKIAHAWNTDDNKEVEKIYEMSSRYLFFVGAVLFCFLYAGTDLFFLILPPDYAIGKNVFLIILCCSLFNLLTGVNTTVISLSKHYIVTSILLIILIIVGVLANLWFIPIYGIKGAAIATFMAIGLFNLLKYLYILKAFKMQPLSKHTVFVFVTLLICVALIYFLPDTLNPVFKAFIGCSFTVVVFSLVNIKTHTVEELNKVFKRFKVIT
jgi:O-antigen/teichoic acid export membrane protein